MTHEHEPLVTAVIPVYNHERYVIESIKSIINQTYKNIELIVINDGSKDKSHEMVLTLVEECKRRFVRFEYINRENIGLSATLNQALEMANGKYFSVLASDDVALPEKIDVLITALFSKSENYIAAFGDALFIDDTACKLVLQKDGSLRPDSNAQTQASFLEFYTRHRDFDYRSDMFGTYETFLGGNYVPAMSNVIKTESIIEAGGWTSGNLIEDWELWLKLSKKYKFLYVDRPVALYRWHASNSVKIDCSKMIYGSLLLVNGEHSFCSQNDLMPIWRESHNSLLGEFLLTRSVPAWKRISMIKPGDLDYVVPLFVKAFLNKLFGRK